MQNTNKASHKNSTKEMVTEISSDTTQKLDDRHTVKVNLRQQYFLERELIRREIGDLNQIRAKLGLSQRRICRLLLVDPSAWTRWLKDDAPPHVYQALKWLLQLKTTNPAITGPRDLEGRLEQIHSSHHGKIEDLENQVASLMRELALKSHSPDREITQLALRAQEQRFQAELNRLEERVQHLTISLTPPPKTAPTAAKKSKKARKLSRPKAQAKSKTKTKAKTKAQTKPQKSKSRKKGLKPSKRRARGGRR